MKEDTSDVETEVPGVSELSVNGDRIKGFVLPHFEGVDCGTWDKVTSKHPALLFLPCISLVNSPLGTGIGCGNKC